MSHINTKCLQSGYTPKTGEPRVVPIVQSTTYKYDTCEQMGDLFDLKASGYFYSRIGNPTVAAVENKIADLEGGVGALLTSSGQAASMLSVLNICNAGDHFLCSSELYGGTFNLFGKTLREFGIEVDFFSCDISDDELQGMIRPNTKCIFGETISNPSLDVFDIERIAAIAHKNGLPLIIDNTFATPINCRPFEFGADIVIHSTTKYMDGHALQVGGVIVDSGNFDWKASGKFPGLCTPDESYHGLTYTESFGKAAYITKARTHLMRDIGATPSPMNAFLLNVGLETLFLRVARHCENARRVAEFLSSNDKISWVKYPGLDGYKRNDLVKKYLPDGSCGVISFGVKGGREASVKFMNSLKLACIVTHVADARTCVLHPASTTHRQLTDEQLKECAITPDLVRMSVGIEFADDIIDDIKQALEKV